MAERLPPADGRGAATTGATATGAAMSAPGRSWAVELLAPKAAPIPWGLAIEAAVAVGGSFGIAVLSGHTVDGLLAGLGALPVAAAAPDAASGWPPTPHVAAVRIPSYRPHRTRGDMTDQYGSNQDPGGTAFGGPPPSPQQRWMPAPPPPPGSLSGGYSGGGVDVPSGTQLASAGRRVGAYFLSLVLAVVTLGIGYVIWSAVLWQRGSTPAYQLLGMRCWHVQDRRTASFGDMALREVVGRFLIMGIIPIVSFVSSIVSFVMFLARSDRRGIPDLISGTIVVYDPSRTLG